jgi:hypothetical protein
MPFYANVGYKFQLEPSIHPNGSIIPASTLAMHTLERRRFDSRYPHLANRLFDPQLYLAGLDPAASRKVCTKLATYPWFGISGLRPYDSKEQTQTQWKKASEARIHKLWPKVAPADPAVIREAVRQCIEFQVRIGCSSVILPSPLTIDPGTDYSAELEWLDAGLDYARQEHPISVPVFATVAVSDGCLRFVDPTQNALLDLILDSVSARAVDGVYIVVEQNAEPSEARHCGSSTTLLSILHLTHLFAHDARVRVGVNFIGFFGLACEAAGAEFWASGWYRSLLRCRLADHMEGGRAFPMYWSFPAALEVNMASDFDQLVGAGILGAIQDVTPASQGLIAAARNGRSAQSVPTWRYAMSNIGAAQEHFMISAVNGETELVGLPEAGKLHFVTRWLTDAAQHATQIGNTSGMGGRTRTGHVQAWLDAFTAFRRLHSV